MWRVSAVSASTWFFFMLPLLVAAVSTVITRGYRSFYVLGFTLANMATGFIESFYRTYLAQRLDPKFQHAPSAQFEIDLAGRALIGMLGVLVLSGALAVLGRTMRPRDPRAVFVSATLGAAYTLVPAAADELGWPMPFAFFWVWTFAFPVISAHIALRRGPVNGSPAMESQNPLLR